MIDKEKRTVEQASVEDAPPSWHILFWKFLGSLLLFIVGISLFILAGTGKIIGTYNYTHPKFLTCTVEKAEPAQWGLTEEQLQEKNVYAKLRITTHECGAVRYEGYAYGKSLNELTEYINSHAGEQILFKVPAIHFRLSTRYEVSMMKIGELDYENWDITTNAPYGADPKTPMLPGGFLWFDARVKGAEQ